MKRKTRNPACAMPLVRLLLVWTCALGVVLSAWPLALAEEAPPLKRREDWLGPERWRGARLCAYRRPPVA